MKPGILLACSLFAFASVSAHAAVFTIGDVGTDAGVNNWPMGEAPPFAVDGDATTKYLNFGELRTGYIFTSASGGPTAPVVGITFATANDAPERDPASYILYGSNTESASTIVGTTYDTSDFTQISSGALALPATRLTVGPGVTFTNTTGYSTYLLVFPTVKDDTTANSMQIGEARLQTGGGDLTDGRIAGGQLSIPEPGTAALAGLLGLVLAVRRRR